MARLVSLLLILVACTQASPVRDLPIDQVKLPPGFSIEVFANNVPNARQMALGDRDDLRGQSHRRKRAHALVDRNGDMKVDEVLTIATGLNMPSGLAFRNGALYVAEVSRVIRYDAIEFSLQAPPPPAVVNDSLPKEGHHGWKYLGFGPDGLLYVPVGAPCNICEPPTIRDSPPSPA